MCNLSQGIAKGITQGREEGREEAETKIIISMCRNGFTIEQIARITEKGIDEIKDIIEKSDKMPCSLKNR